MTAARLVFGRDGYARASIDSIAAAARVSTRTIYNHYESKELLFSTVLESSAAQVADAFVARADRLRGRSADVTATLVALGEAVAVQSLEFPEHFAMVRQISAEVGHFPERVLTAWTDAGPRRVERSVVEVLSDLVGDGRLHVEDVERAARHFTALVAAELYDRPLQRDRPTTSAQRTDSIAAAVDVFLHGYGAPAPGVDRTA